MIRSKRRMMKKSNGGKLMTKILRKKEKRRKGAINRGKYNGQLEIWKKRMGRRGWVEEDG